MTHHGRAAVERAHSPEHLLGWGASAALDGAHDNGCVTFLVGWHVGRCGRGRGDDDGWYVSLRLVGYRGYQFRRDGEECGGCVAPLQAAPPPFMQFPFRIIMTQRESDDGHRRSESYAH